jgi:L-aminopeptidase/D-esterase-like protein
MIRPGPLNLITDVDGLRVGNAADPRVRTGVTVILPEPAATAAVDVRGGAPGTRETNALDPTCLLDAVHAIVLAGGSAFGLDAAGAVMEWLAARGIGFAVGPARVPLVPAAILFDLLNGGDKAGPPPHRALAVAACESAETRFALGNTGAGYGAKAGALKGGLGSASAVTEKGLQVGALVAANPRGHVVMPDGCFWAWPHEFDGEFGSRRPGAPVPPEYGLERLEARPAENTTIGVVATNAVLSQSEAQRIAIMAQDGYARAIRPVHTPFDGDTLFVLATGRHALPEPRPSAIARLGALAADTVARAIARGIYEAETLSPWPSWRATFGKA